ncbi:MAG: asparaginase [Aliivibrio sp.]|uniref:asparaginase n=1 Tax=Aliivibrio sp. TaxID=1872443 RepID=UPI001A4C0601|nr:asparaginase [Aliivibrio sp.]
MTDQKELDSLFADAKKAISKKNIGIETVEDELDILKSKIIDTYDDQIDGKTILSKVYVLYTGGTFGMKKAEDIPGNPLIPMTLDELQNKIPRSSKFVKNTYVKIDSFPVSDLLDSSSMTPDDWKLIAKKIEEHYDEFDGFVVIQGTDTLSYTASAMSFMFENLAKPVVITGSQLPLPEERTDAKLNYGHALQVAASKASGLPHIPEVVVVFADRILRGCRTRKMSASAWTGFDTPNCPPLGEIGEHVRIFENQIRPAPPAGRKFRANMNLVTDVMDISLFPGFQAKDISRILEPKSLKGVVLRTYGTGNAPDNSEFLNTLDKAINDDGKVVLNITQCPQGAVEMGLYAASVGLLDAGVISGLDMTPEAALTKMMVTMGANVGDQIKLQMQIDQRGEQSQNLFDLKYQIGPFFSKGMLKNEMSQYAQPDGRFKSVDLSSAVLRIEGLEFSGDGTDNGYLGVFMNRPSSNRDDLEKDAHPDLICKIRLVDGMQAQIVEQLRKDQIRDIIGDSVVTLTFVPSKGISFGMASLSLSLFTKA